MRYQKDRHVLLKNTHKREKERRKGGREGGKKGRRKERKKLMMEDKDLRVFSMCNLCGRQEEGQIRGFGDPKSLCELPTGALDLMRKI